MIEYVSLVTALMFDSLHVLVLEYEFRCVDCFSRRAILTGLGQLRSKLILCFATDDLSLSTIAIVGLEELFKRQPLQVGLVPVMQHAWEFLLDNLAIDLRWVQVIDLRHNLHVSKRAYAAVF